MTLPYLAVAVYVTIVIIGVVGVHAVQAIMAIILFVAADKVIMTSYGPRSAAPSLFMQFFYFDGQCSQTFVFMGLSDCHGPTGGIRKVQGLPPLVSCFPHISHHCDDNLCSSSLISFY